MEKQYKKERRAIMKGLKKARVTAHLNDDEEKYRQLAILKEQFGPDYGLNSNKRLKITV